MCCIAVPTSAELRVHLSAVVPGFYVHVVWRERWQAFEAFFWSSKVSLSFINDDHLEAEHEVLMEAVRELDSGFLLSRNLNPPPTEEQRD